MAERTHKHHGVAKSRGGPDEDWNFIDLDPYSHAYEHALDFVLFDHAPQFDFRHEAWSLLPEDLKKAVLTRKAEWCQNFFTGNPRPPEVCEKISKTKTGIPNTEESKRKMSEAKLGEKHPLFGKSRPEHSKKMTGEGNPKSKKVEVTYPNGFVKVFPCTKDAGETLGGSAASVAKWSSNTHTPRTGRFAGYSFRYL